MDLAQPGEGRGDCALADGTKPTVIRSKNTAIEVSERFIDMFLAYCSATFSTSGSFHVWSNKGFCGP